MPRHDTVRHTLADTCRHFHTLTCTDVHIHIHTSSHSYTQIHIQTDIKRHIPCVGALSETTGQGSERKAALPKQKTAERPTTRQAGRRRRFRVPFLVGGSLEVVVEQSPETRRCVLTVVLKPYRHITIDACLMLFTRIYTSAFVDL